jgi:hypothetical protein
MVSKTRKLIKKPWRIVIPSYMRETTLRDKTLRILHEYHIPTDKIWIVVANKDQKQIYEDALPNIPPRHIIVGVPGLAEVRNYIADHVVKPGEHYVTMDDDITGFVERTQSGGIRKLTSLTRLIDLGFKEAEKVGASLWGVYPVPNGFFMKPTITTDLKFIVGSFCGLINPTATKKPNGIAVPMSEKDDYFRTLMAWDRDGAVVRINYVSVKTAYYKEPGGLQAFPDRLARQHKAVKELMKKWPDKVRLNPRRKGDFPEILLGRVKSE